MTKPLRGKAHKATFDALLKPRKKRRAATGGRASRSQVAESRGAQHFVCPDCGPCVRVDEDGCCHTCGRDTRVEVCTCGQTLAEAMLALAKNLNQQAGWLQGQLPAIYDPCSRRVNQESTDIFYSIAYRIRETVRQAREVTG